jgi:hypothetical protein
MIKNTDILSAISTLLDSKFSGYTIFDEENTKEVKSPTFFIQVSPLTSNSFLRYNEKLTNITITFVDKVITQVKLLDMQNELDELFDMNIQVGSRKIAIDKKTFNRTNDFLTMKITLDYLDNKSSLPKNEQSTDKMGELNINE